MLQRDPLQQKQQVKNRAEREKELCFFWAFLPAQALHMPKQRWHKSSRSGLLFAFWGGSGLVLMNRKEPSQVPWGIPWLHRQPNTKQRCVQFWVSHSPFWCWIPAWHCAINSDIKDPETQGPLCNSGFGLGQTNKQTNMFGLGHRLWLNHIIVLAQYLWLQTYLPLYAGWRLCVHTGKCREASGEGQQSSGEFCMLGAHTEPSRWINKGLLASDCANFLTFGIINDFSLPLEKKRSQQFLYFSETQAKHLAPQISS